MDHIKKAEKPITDRPGTNTRDNIYEQAIRDRYHQDLYRYRNGQMSVDELNNLLNVERFVGEERSDLRNLFSRH